MKRKRILAFLWSLCLLTGCTLIPAEPTPEPTEPPTALTWLHAFYANSSYSQIGLTDTMDAVSLGWAVGSGVTKAHPASNSTLHIKARIFFLFMANLR